MNRTCSAGTDMSSIPHNHEKPADEHSQEVQAGSLKVSANPDHEQNKECSEIDNNVGPCPECYSPVVQYADRFECSRAGSGCGFTIGIDVIKAAVTDKVIDIVHDAIIGSDSKINALINQLLPSKWVKTAWPDSDNNMIYEFYVMVLGRSLAGAWMLVIIPEQEAALANDRFDRRVSESRSLSAGTAFTDDGSSFFD